MPREYLLQKTLRNITKIHLWKLNNFLFMIIKLRKYGKKRKGRDFMKNKRPWNNLI